MFGLSVFRLTRRHSSGHPLYPGDLLPEVQSVLSALADVECRYETAHAFLEQWPGPADVKQSCLDALSESRKRERGLLIQQLDEVEQRLTSVPEKESIRRSVPDHAAVFVIESA